MSQTKSQQHTKTWFTICMILCGIIILTSIAGYLITEYTFIGVSGSPHTVVRKHVVLSIKSLTGNQYQETFTDVFHLSSVSLPVSKEQLNQYPAKTRGTLVFRKGKLLMFQPDSQNTQDRETIEREIQKVKYLSQ